MRTRRIAILLVALIVVAGAFYGAVASRSRANMDRLVARALSGNASYVAQVVTSTKYNGKTIRTHATVFHQDGIEKVRYAGDRPVWSMTRDGKSYTYLPQSNKLLISETGRLLSDADRNALLMSNYKSISNGTDEVAGRDAYVVEISSRRDGHPCKKLWIDKRRLTVLKSVDYSAAGDERGRMVTERIRYNPKIGPETFAVGGSPQVVRVCTSSDSMNLFKTLGMPVRLPKYLPPGYKLEGYHLFNSQCNCGHRSAQLTYSDGLNIISVFQTPRTACCGAGMCKLNCGGSSKGCTVANRDVAKTGQITRGDRTIVVVGDLLPEEIRKVAESVK